MWSCAMALHKASAFYLHYIQDLSTCLRHFKVKNVYIIRKNNQHNNTHPSRLLIFCKCGQKLREVITDMNIMISLAFY